MRFPRTVYAIQHNKTNRVYVGSSANPKQRFAAHISQLCAGKHPVEDMQSDFDEFGNDYTLYFCEVIADPSTKHHEYDWMKLFNSHIRGEGYNYKDRFFEDRTQSKKTEYRIEFLKLLRDTEDVAVLDLVLKLWKGLVKRDE